MCSMMECMHTYSRPIPTVCGGIGVITILGVVVGVLAGDGIHLGGTVGMAQVIGEEAIGGITIIIGIRIGTMDRCMQV